MLNAQPTAGQSAPSSTAAVACRCCCWPAGRATGCPPPRLGGWQGPAALCLALLIALPRNIAPEPRRSQRDVRE